MYFLLSLYWFIVEKMEFENGLGVIVGSDSIVLGVDKGVVFLFVIGEFSIENEKI